MNTANKTRILAECAVLIALGTILAQIKVYEMPNGGSITAASMVPFILVSFRHGAKWGLLTGFANSLLQMLLGGLWPTPAGTALAMGLEVILDYLVPFTVLGIAYVFAKPFGENRKLEGIVCGTICVCFLRFLAHFLSGIIVWGSITEDGIGAVTYSASYNGSFMSIETVITVVVIVLLYKSVPKLFKA
ncbi:MAG: energy-coupled thiamine transporter ThiT [Clostridia bacterium]|nr:energy-coupled thiamine transporter ThiT [Clostridia bacterium]